MLRAGVESEPDGEEGWGWWGDPYSLDPLRSKAAGRHSPTASLYFFSVSLSLLQSKLHRQWAFPIASQCLLGAGFTYHVKKWEWESAGPLSEESEKSLGYEKISFLLCWFHTKFNIDIWVENQDSTVFPVLTTEKGGGGRIVQTRRKSNPFLSQPFSSRTGEKGASHRLHVAVGWLPRSKGLPSDQHWKPSLHSPPIACVALLYYHLKFLLWSI